MPILEATPGSFVAIQQFKAASPGRLVLGQPVPNRLRLLRDWVAGGGALLMIGGYYGECLNARPRDHDPVART